MLIQILGQTGPGDVGLPAGSGRTWCRPQGSAWRRTWTPGSMKLQTWVNSHDAYLEVIGLHVCSSVRTSSLSQCGLRVSLSAGPCLPAAEVCWWRVLTTLSHDCDWAQCYRRTTKSFVSRPADRSSHNDCQAVIGILYDNLTDGGLMLGRSNRRWANIKLTVVARLVFSQIYPGFSYDAQPITFITSWMNEKSRLV